MRDTQWCGTGSITARMNQFDKDLQQLAQLTAPLVAERDRLAEEFRSTRDMRLLEKYVEVVDAIQSLEFQWTEVRGS